MGIKGITYQINFQSDYHIGSGIGIAGVVDSLLIKDAKGRLYIPGKTIKGIVRDACEDVIDFLKVPNICDGVAAAGKTLCGIKKQEKPCLRCLIFGSEVTPAHFRFRSARRRDAVGEILGDPRMAFVLSTMSRIETHNRIDRQSNVAVEDMLFSYELGKKTETHKASIDQVAAFESKELEKNAYALLIAGLRFVVRIGGKRRRGKGRCRFDIDEAIGRFCTYDWKELIESLCEPKVIQNDTEAVS